MNNEKYCLSKTKEYDYLFKYCPSCRGIVGIFDVEKNSYEDDAAIAFELATEKWSKTMDHTKLAKPHLCVCVEIKAKLVAIRDDSVVSETSWHVLKKEKTTSFLQKTITTNRELSDEEMFAISRLYEILSPHYSPITGEPLGNNKYRFHGVWDSSE